MAKENQTIKKKKMNPVLWILFAIIIPLIIVIVIICVVLGLAGFSVFDWAEENDIPVISSLVSSEEDTNTEQEEERMTSLLTSKDEEIEQLNLEINDLQTNLTELEQELLKSENVSEPAEEADAALSEDNPSSDDSVKQIVTSFEEMDSESAAAIIGHMDQEEALVILQAISNDIRGEILQEMEPELAAEFTALLMGE